MTSHAVKKIMALTLALLLGTMGCTVAPDGKKAVSAATPDIVAQPIYPKAISFDDVDAQRSIRHENQNSEVFLKGIDNFSYDTGARLFSGEKGNCFYSPLSLYYALAISEAGASGESRAALLKVLRAEDSELLEAESAKLFKRLYSKNDIKKLELANSLWLDTTFLDKEISFKEAFLDRAKTAYYASVFDAEFGSEATAQAMGKWISEHTGGRLNPTFEPNPEQIMSIINTLYYANQWDNQFNRSHTKKDTFHKADGTTVTCDFMNISFMSMGFEKGKGFTRAALSLKGGGQMIFVLPDKGTSLERLIDTSEGMKALFESGEQKYGEVTWKVPKLSMDSDLDLKPMLTAMGLEVLFTDRADFSNMVDAPVFISSVIQQTYLGVNEDGVEAAAFTKIDLCGAGMPVDRADMILDRPFLFAIEEQGTLLFMGICNNPIQ